MRGVGLLTDKPEHKIDFKAIFAAVRDNRDKLDACKRHLFNSEIPGIEGGVAAMFGRKMECVNCGGSMDLTAINHYVRGYEAHGGNGDDILPGWREEPNAGNGRRYFKGDADR